MSEGSEPDPSEIAIENLYPALLSCFAIITVGYVNINELSMNLCSLQKKIFILFIYNHLFYRRRT